MPTETKPAPISLDDETGLVEFSVRGQTFLVDPYEAGDRLREIDQRHKEDANTCLDCGKKLPPFYGEDGTQAPGVACGGCGSRNVYICQDFLDDVAKLLTEHYGAPRLTRSAAGKFYTAMVEVMQSLKKTTSTTPQSPTGTESIQQAGTAPESAPDSTTLPDSTPNEDSNLKTLAV